MLGLRLCARAFSSCGKWGPLFIAVRGPLTIAASPVAEHRLQTRRLSNCGSRAQPLRGMWDLPRPGLEPVSPALAGRFPTTAPPGKPQLLFFNLNNVPQFFTRQIFFKVSFPLILTWKKASISIQMQLLSYLYPGQSNVKYYWSILCCFAMSLTTIYPLQKG